MDYTRYLVNNAYVLIPVLYILGSIMKDSKTVSDKYIPIILLVMGILFACGWMGFNMNSVIQGVLITGITVYSNQVIKQLKKDDTVIADHGTNIIDNTSEEIKTEATTTAVNDIITQNSQSSGLVLDSAKSKGRVDNPENTITDGATVNVTSALTPSK